jgi:hypothetical protein
MAKTVGLNRFDKNRYMHATLHPNVFGYIDTQKYDAKVRGWCFHSSRAKLPIRLIGGELKEEERADVAAFYKADVAFCGWSFQRTTFPYQIQMQIGSEWITVLEETEQKIVTGTRKVLPSFLVVDDFYSDPDSVRAFALQQTLVQHPNNHKGIRSDTVYRFPGLKERFETLLGTPIHGWEDYGTNGCFQINVAGEQPVYHADTQTYAGVIFLTPDSPAQAGTQFYRSKDGIRKPDAIHHASVFKGGYYDSTRFEKIDVVGNIYNRLVLFDAHMIHAADTYFGKTREDGRLIQLFFFDV